MKKLPKQSQSSKNDKSIRQKAANKGLLLLAFVLWCGVCVAFYYLSIVKSMLWVIDLYMLTAIPCLFAAIAINAYCNAKYSNPDNENKPSEAFVKKIRKIVKILIFIGFPLLSCVLIEFIAAWLIGKFNLN